MSPPKRKCDWCGIAFTKKHPSQRFHIKHCKNKYHNEHNPRGKFAHLNPRSADYDPENDPRLMGDADVDDPSWDAHK